MNEWPFWEFEENISIVNENAEEAEKARKKEEEKQKASMPNFNPSSMIKSATSQFK